MSSLKSVYLSISDLFVTYELEVCGSTISDTRPVPVGRVADNACPYPYPTRAENFYSTRPVGIPVP